MKKIKILFAIGRMSVGGAEKLLVHQLATINTNNFDPYLITLFPEQSESIIDQITIQSDNRKQFHFRSLLDIPQWSALHAYLRNEQFDVIVTSLFSANLIVRVINMFMKQRALVISYEHNLYPNKHKWQILMDRWLAKQTKIIIVDSEIVRTFTAQQENIPIEKFITMYIPPLLEKKPDQRSPEEIRKMLKIKPGNKVVLTVSRLVTEKGHRYLIEAANEVLKKFPSTTFVLVGWGPLEQELKSQIKELGITDNFLMPGRMNIQEVLPIADIYAEPATMTDLPIAIMEAMRTEKPIVSTDVGEIPVFIKNNTTGLIVSTENSNALSQKIEMLLENSEFAKKLGKDAGILVEKYSLLNYMANFEKLIIDFYNNKNTN